MSTEAEPPHQAADGTAGTRPPAIARYWWLTALRGVVALTRGLDQSQVTAECGRDLRRCGVGRAGLEPATQGL